MHPEELKKKIKGGDIDPLYYFYGQNTYLIAEVLAALETALFSAAVSDFDYCSYDAQTHGLSEILNAVRTLPLSSPKRLVVVKRADTFKPAQWEEFQHYFAKPSALCCLVFTAAELHIKEKLLTTFKNKGTVVAFANPYKNQAHALVQNIASEHGKKLSPDALRFFVETVGTDHQMIVNEFEKVILYCRDKQRIAKEDIEDVIAGSGDQTIFNLMDAIGLGNIEHAETLLNGLLEKGLPPLQILWMIARQLRNITIAKEGIQGGAKHAEIAKKLKIRFKINDFMDQVQGWSLNVIGKAFEEISLSDLRLKSSRIDKKIILEYLIVQLSNLRAYEAP